MEFILQRRDPYFIPLFLAGLLTGFLFYYLPFLTALSLVAVVALVLLTWKWLEVGIYFCLLFVPVELHSLEFLPGFVKYIDELLLVFMAGIILYRIVVKEEKFDPTPLGTPLFVFIGVGLASMVFNRVNPIVGIAGLRAMLQYVILYFVMVHAGLDKEKYRRLITLFLIVAAITVFYGYFQQAIGLEASADWEMRRYHQDIDLRVYSTMENPNTYGAYLVVMMGITLNLFFSYFKFNRLKSIYPGILALLLFWGLVMTYSRMSLLSLLVALVALAFIRFRKYVPLLVLGGIGVLLILPPEFYSRLTFVLSPEYIELSLKGGRLYLMQKSWEVISLSPLLGVGPGMFGGSVAGIFDSPIYELMDMPYHMNLDNFYFQVWTELGTLGFGAFLWLFISIIKQALRAYRQVTDPYWQAVAAGALTVFAGVTFQSLVAGIWEVHQVAAYLWFLAALTYLMNNRWGETTRKEREETAHEYS